MRRTSSVLILVAGLALNSEPINGCSCTQKEVASYFDAAQAVFMGYPTTVRLDQHPAGQKEPLANLILRRTVIEWHVEKWWKGEAATTAIVSTGMGGGDCGSDFRVGTRYIVFAAETRNGLATSICSGNLYFATAGRKVGELDRLASAGEPQ